MDGCNNENFESVKTLIRLLHEPQNNVESPQSDESNVQHVNNDNTEISPPILTITPPKKLYQSYFDNALKIPVFKVSSPQSTDSPDNNSNRRFSFELRRHSHMVQ